MDNYFILFLDDSRRWCSVRVGLQKHHYQVPVGKEAWSATYSFMIHNLQNDVVRRSVGAGVWRRSLGAGGGGGGEYSNCVCREVGNTPDTFMPHKYKSVQLIFNITRFAMSAQMILKIKQRRVMWNVPLAVHSLSLEGLSTLNNAQAEKTVHLHNTEANIAVDMEYTPLQAISVQSPNSITIDTQGECGGG